MDDLLEQLGGPGELAAVKDAVVSAFQTAMPKGVEVYYGVPTSMHFPCLCVGEVEISGPQTMGGDTQGMERFVLTISVFVSAAEDVDAQRVLDAMLARGGKIRTALWEMRGEPGQEALGGAADDISFTGVSGYGLISIGDNGSAYGATISTLVIVS